ncbi:MAG: D-alanyl-D-alanine carboxypeptidase [Clostridia bacterium]|nr:D-alanyl-D-alanine carboxypeptidase [Clostridia bacterium]
MMQRLPVRLFCALLAFFCCWASLLPVIPLTAALAEEVEYVAPRLPSGVDPYDPEKPEELSPDQLYAKSAILIEATTGEVIMEKNADQIMYPASTTKILTVLLGIMMGDLNQTVTMTETAMVYEEGVSEIPLEVGETINFTDLLYATMVRSGNEGANLIAETIAGDTYSFAELMNNAAAMYGCTNTHFTNANGLHDDNHYSTARDMAKIARAAMENDLFRQISSTYTYTLPRSNLHRSRLLTGASSNWLNKNQETTEDYTSTYYPYATGIKTGFHARAGYCYVGAAERDGVQLISVVFYTSNSGRWSDSRKLMEYGFSQFVSMTPEELYNENPVIVDTSGFSLEDENLGRLTLNVQPRADQRTVNIVATKAEMEAKARNLRQTVLIEYTRDFAAPITQGEVMGTMTYYPEDGGSAVVYDLVAGRSIMRRENAPLTLEEIEHLVFSDPNPFPPLTLDILLLFLSPLIVLVLLIVVLRRIFHKKGRHYRRGRLPKAQNRHYR